MNYLFRALQMTLPREGGIVLKKLQDLIICFDQIKGVGGSGESHYASNDSVMASSQLLSVLRIRTSAGVQKLTYLNVPECAYDSQLDDFAEAVTIGECWTCRYVEDY